MGSQLATVDKAGSTPIDHERNKYLVRRTSSVSTPNEDFYSINFKNIGRTFGEEMK